MSGSPKSLGSPQPKLRTRSTNGSERGGVTLALPIILVPHPHVTVSETVLGGSPFVTGSRVPVRRLYAFYRSGATIEQLIKRFPHLSPAKVFDALAFALDNAEVMDADMAREADMLKR